MNKRGLLMREEAGGRLRIAGRHIGIASPGGDGTYRIVFNDRDQPNRIELELSEEAFDELEDVISTLRINQPRFERERRNAPEIMKKFMLDQSLFPDWPPRGMEACYRSEGTLLGHEEILEWRHALRRPDTNPSLQAKLVLSTTRREASEYRRLFQQILVDRMERDAPAVFSGYGRSGLLAVIEQNLVGAYPFDEFDREGAIAAVRREALDTLMPWAIQSARPKQAESRMIA